MNNLYIKDSPRGDSKEQSKLLDSLPAVIDHLNSLKISLSFIQRIREIVPNPDNDILVKLSDIERLGKFNAFLNLCILDSTIVYKNALSAIHFWDEIHSLRQGYLLIFEALKTYQSHSKSLKEFATKASTATEIGFNTLTEKIRSFRRDYDYDNSILGVRNYTIGHIDRDPVLFYDTISKLDTDKAFAALKEFISILVCMLTLSDDIYKNHIHKEVTKYSLQVSSLHPVEINRLLKAMESQISE